MAKTQKTSVIKASFASTSTSVASELDAKIQGKKAIEGVLSPPYDPLRLTALTEGSSMLTQHIEAIATNVDQFGWQYESTLKFDALDIAARVKEAMSVEKLENVDKTTAKTITPPTEQEVQARLQELIWQSKFELNKLKTFFAVCYADGSFLDLRTKTRKNLEATGNAFWEILRNAKGEISRIVLANVNFMRLLPQDKFPTTITERAPISEISWTETTQQRFFRRYAEIANDQQKVKAYFKEYGDPRVISQMTGKIYDTIKDFDKDPHKKKGDMPATEIYHFTIYSAAADPYGAPRWIGNLAAVLGSRELDEVNYSYFQNKTVPPLALLVSGGRLSKGVVPRIEEFIEQNIKGKKNYHKILILEAEGQKSVGSATSTVPTIKFVPLRESQQQDALFQNYDEANWEKVGSSFRLPRLLVGKDKQINRSTSESSLRFAEEQVFEPLRNSFDETINRVILAQLGVTLWRFRSNTPITRNPEILGSVLKLLSDSGIITPAEGRAFAADVFNRDLPYIDEPWTQQPFKLTLAEARKGVLEGEEGSPAGDGANNKETSDENSTDQGTESSGNQEQATRKAAIRLAVGRTLRAMHDDEDDRDT